MSIHDPAAQRITGEEGNEFFFWTQTKPEELERWRNADGTLRVLSDEELQALYEAEWKPGLARYRIAQRRAALGWAPFG